MNERTIVPEPIDRFLRAAADAQAERVSLAAAPAELVAERIAARVGRRGPWAARLPARARALVLVAALLLLAAALTWGLAVGSGLLPSTPRSDEHSQRLADPLGDAVGGAPDIAAVTTTRRADEVVVEVELAEDWVLSEMSLLVYLETGGGPLKGGREIPLSDPTWCYPWFMEAFVTVGEGGPWNPSGEEGARVSAAGEGVPLGEPLPYAIRGSRLTLVIPLWVVEDPEMLTLLVRTSGRASDFEASDWFPNEELTCHPVILPSEVPSE